MAEPKRKGQIGEVRPEEVLLGETLEQFHALLNVCNFAPDRYLQPPRVHPREPQSDTAHFLRLKGGAPEDLVPAARMLQLWFCEPRFLSDSGAPVPLPLSGEISLSALLEASACRLDPRSVRDTLVEAGLAERRGDFIRPLTRIVLGKGDQRAKQVMYSLRDLMATLNFNMRSTGGQPKRFQRFVFDTKVPMARVEEFEMFLEKQALEFLFMVEEWMLTAEKTAAPGEPMLPMNVHLFSSAPDGVVRSTQAISRKPQELAHLPIKVRSVKRSPKPKRVARGKKRKQLKRVKRSGT